MKVERLIMDFVKNHRFPVDYYSNNLILLCKTYLDNVKLENNTNRLSSEETREALKWIVFSNDKSITNKISDINSSVSKDVSKKVHNYLSCIMQLLGKIAECALMNQCIHNSDTNMICMNIASMKDEIYTLYQDICYNDYTPFSTSYKHFIYMQNGILYTKPCPDYNPGHTTKDIAWCKKDNICNQLKVSLPHLDYLDNAKLQVKTTINCNNPELKQYYLTPVVCFDLCHDIQILKNKYPNQIIYSINEIDQQVGIDVENYFRILAAYATEMTTYIDIKQLDLEPVHISVDIIRKID